MPPMLLPLKVDKGNFCGKWYMPSINFRTRAFSAAKPKALALNVSTYHSVAGGAVASAPFSGLPCCVAGTIF
jgi:hypothetical protein